MVHLIMIILHATAASLCFIFGALTLLPHLSNRSRLTLFTFYVAALTAMIVFLAAAILAHVGQLAALQRGIFAGLFVLSLYLLFRGTRARTVLRAQPDDWWTLYVDHIGFTLISLFEGFIIVSGIDLGAPGWLTAVVAVLGVVVGSRVLHSLQTPARQPQVKL
jgi:uncharacterized membrane protein